MNKNSNNRRSRGRGGNKRHGNVRNQTFESNGPGVKVRGSAQQVLDKYLLLARDASSAGDRIMAESYFQFAEHYFRLLNTDEQRNADRNGQNRGRPDGGARQTPGGAEGGPEDNMGGDYDDDMDNDGDQDDADAEVIHTNRPQANDGDNRDERDSRDNGRNGSGNKAEAADEADAPAAKPARAPRGRRRKAPEPQQESQQAELPMAAKPDAQPEVEPEQPVATDAAD
ncbi:DUF4167 domain-containing protein [bacterium SCSIO 12827]|nr:DUF4167 domain-containing protein [bacterium SCSIO 12827]